MDETPQNNTPPSTKTNWLSFGLIAVFIILVLALLGYLYFNPQTTDKEDSSEQAGQVSVSPEEGQVNITKDKFDPESIKVKIGTKVVWTNMDDSVHQVASDPHPTHDLLKELGDGEVLSKGDSFEFTFEKKGKFTYHDNLNPLKLRGEVVVE